MSKVKVMTLVLLCTASGASQATQWTEHLKDVMVSGCIEGLVQQMKVRFTEQAELLKSKNIEFDEQGLKSSGKIFCSCVVSRAEKKWSFDEYTSDRKYMRQLTIEAMNGGQCRPTGYLGAILTKGSQSQN